MTEDEIVRRSSNMLASSKDGTAYSKWERIERMKPKPKSDDEEEEPEEEEDENAPEKLYDDQMLFRPCDHEDVVKA